MTERHRRAGHFAGQSPSKRNQRVAALRGFFDRLVTVPAIIGNA